MNHFAQLMGLIFSAETSDVHIKYSHCSNPSSYILFFPLLFLCEPWELGGSGLDHLSFPLLVHKGA